MNKQKDRLVELIGEELLNYSSWSTEMALQGTYEMPSAEEVIADKLLADGWMRPPCKVGQTVYLLQKYYGTYCFNVVEDNVQMIGVTSRGIHIKARNHQDHNKMYMLGKTVFLTKEEAEAKLKEGVQG